MRRIVFFVCAAAMLAVSCKQEVGEKRISLSTADDSLAYAVSVYLAQDMRQLIMQEFSIDSSTVDDFVRGVRDAFPKSSGKHDIAYTNGQQIGSRAADMLRRAEELIYGSDTTKKIDSEIFLEGLVASIYAQGRTMDMRHAIDYYNIYKYRVVSDKFMADNATREGITVLPDGLQYKMEHKGNGAVATPADTVCCIYKGTLTSGRTFDSSRGSIAKLHVGSLIPGFAKALCMLPEGTKCKVYIPWELGYGAKGTRRIPPYSTLVFDIEVAKVIKNR